MSSSKSSYCVYKSSGESPIPLFNCCFSGCPEVSLDKAAGFSDGAICGSKSLQLAIRSDLGHLQMTT